MPRAVAAFGLLARPAFGWPQSLALAQSNTGLFDDAGGVNAKFLHGINELSVGVERRYG